MIEGSWVFLFFSKMSSGCGFDIHKFHNHILSKVCYQLLGKFCVKRSDAFWYFLKDSGILQIMEPINDFKALV